MATNDTWVSSVAQKANGEISQAFNQLHSNINWALALVSVILTGIVVKGGFDWTTVGITLFSLVMVIGFFVRSALGYVNLSRWNGINSAASAYLEANDQEKEAKLTVLELKYEAYVTDWFSPLTRKGAILSDAKFFRFWFIAGAIVAALAYQLYKIGFGQGAVSTSNIAGALVVSGVGFVAVIYEVSSLFDGTYFRFVSSTRESIDRAKELGKKPDPMFRRILAYLGVAFLIVAVIIVMSGAQSGSSSYTNSSLGRIGDYYAVQLPSGSGTEVSISWQTSSPGVSGIITAGHLTDLNRSDLANASLTSYGSGASASYLALEPSYFFVTSSQTVLVNLTFSSDQSATNFLVLVLYTGGILISIASVVWKSQLDRNKLVRASRTGNPGSSGERAPHKEAKAA